MEEKKFDDLKKIKKTYGEKFSHLCRELFPTLLEKEGLLYEVISKHFAPTRSLYDAIMQEHREDDFKSYVYSFVDVEKEEKQLANPKSPEELLDEAGYVLFPECKTEAEVQSFKKYYAPGEALCTFNGGRLNRCRVWFAVKKNVEEIKRENFTSPKRQDEYGTSVISIQFSKGKQSTLSIKNRYNHTVNDPDATFSNNLDNIIPGLTQAFVDTHSISLLNAGKPTFELENFALGDDGKFYRSSLERNNIHYCENNVIVDNGHVKVFDKSRYEIVDCFVIDKSGDRIVDDGEIDIDKKQKTIKLYDKNLVDCFPETVGEIKEIKILNTENGNRVFSIIPSAGENVEIVVNAHNEIVGYKNPNVTTIGNCFLYNNETLKELSLPNVTTIGDRFLHRNETLTELSLPNVTTIGNSLLYNNKTLKDLSLPNVTTIGYCFLYSNITLKELSLPYVTTIGDCFLNRNKTLKELSLPNVTTIGNDFLNNNETLKELSLPNVTTIGYFFLYNNETLKELSLPNVTTIGYFFLYNNETLKKFYAPKMKKGEIYEGHLKAWKRGAKEDKEK